MYEFKLPDLGEGIHEGEILKWHVKPGDLIKEDENLIDVETDKAAVTIPSPAAGKVISVVGNSGDMISTGQVIVTIDDGNGSAAVATPAGSADEAGGTNGGNGGSAGLADFNQRSASAAQPAERAAPAQRGDRPVPAAPATRKLARELGVNLKLVPSSGPGGRVTAEDVKMFSKSAGSGETEETGKTALKAVATDTPAASREPSTDTGIPFYDPEPMPEFEKWGEVEREPIRSIRRRTARRMVTSKTVVPHVAHMDEIDVTDLEKLRIRERDRAKESGDTKVTLLAMVVKAVIAGMRRAPFLNASLDPQRNEIVYKKYFNIGIATDTGRGLVVPVVKNADEKTVRQISQEIADLAEQARLGSISIGAMQGGSFTITNIGALGGTAVVPAINYPEVAILGMARIQEKPVVIDGEIVVRSMLPVVLAFDHRVIDGAQAARFINDLKAWLSNPDRLLVDC